MSNGEREQPGEDSAGHLTISLSPGGSWRGCLGRFTGPDGGMVNARVHYDKHAAGRREWGDGIRSLQEYIASATELLNRTSGDALFEFRSRDGEHVIKYDADANDLAMANWHDGSIKTLFAPDRGATYVEASIRRGDWLPAADFESLRGATSTLDDHERSASDWVASLNAEVEACIVAIAVASSDGHPGELTVAVGNGASAFALFQLTCRHLDGVQFSEALGRTAAEARRMLASLTGAFDAVDDELDGRLNGLAVEDARRRLESLWQWFRTEASEGAPAPMQLVLDDTLWEGFERLELLVGFLVGRSTEDADLRNDYRELRRGSNELSHQLRSARRPGPRLWEPLTACWWRAASNDEELSQPKKGSAEVAYRVAREPSTSYVGSFLTANNRCPESLVEDGSRKVTEATGRGSVDDQATALAEGATFVATVQRVSKGGLVVSALELPQGYVAASALTRFGTLEPSGNFVVNEHVGLVVRTRATGSGRPVLALDVGASSGEDDAIPNASFYGVVIGFRKTARSVWGYDTALVRIGSGVGVLGVRDILDDPVRHVDRILSMYDVVKVIVREDRVERERSHQRRVRFGLVRLLLPGRWLRGRFAASGGDDISDFEAVRRRDGVASLLDVAAMFGMPRDAIGWMGIAGRVSHERIESPGTSLSPNELLSVIEGLREAGSLAEIVRGAEAWALAVGADNARRQMRDLRIGMGVSWEVCMTKDAVNALVDGLREIVAGSRPPAGPGDRPPSSRTMDDVPPPLVEDEDERGFEAVSASDEVARAAMSHLARIQSEMEMLEALLRRMRVPDGAGREDSGSRASSARANATPDRENEVRERAEQAAANLKVGDRVKGVVVSVRDHGIYVDLGGIEGRIQLQEISHDRGVRSHDVASVGDEIEALVLRIDIPVPGVAPGGDEGEDRGDRNRQKSRFSRPSERMARVELSRRAMEVDPWTDVNNRFPIGSVHQGKVVRMQPFGAFVELEKGLDGLLHVSEIGDRRIGHPNEVLEDDQEVTVRVTKIDRQARRLSLSLLPDGTTEEDLKESVLPRVGMITTATIVEHVAFGMFAQLNNTVGKMGRGLIMPQDSNQPRGTDLKNALPVGTEVKVKVLEIDGVRLKLSIKAAILDEDRQAYRAYQQQANSTTVGKSLLDKLRKLNLGR